MPRIKKEKIETKLDRELLANAISSELMGISAEELVRLFYSKYDAIIDFARLCRGDRQGQKISLLFNPHRLETATISSKSIIDALRTDSFASGLARASAFKDGIVTDRNLLYQVLQLGVNGIQYVNEFPPYTARSVYLHFGAKKILDPCAGWGGRMIGAAAAGAFYHGFEPSTRSYSGLQQLGRFLKSFNTGFDFHIDCMPFEEVNLCSAEYDIALTSPPYFDTEFYADGESTQARTYGTFQDFVDKFYLPMIQRCLEHSRNGMVLNVGSRRYPLRQTAQDVYGTDATLFDAVKLSGSGGLGKEGAEGEIFLHIGGNGAYFSP